MTKAREREPSAGCSRCWPHAVGREAGPKGSWGGHLVSGNNRLGLSVVAYLILFLALLERQSHTRPHVEYRTPAASGVLGTVRAKQNICLTSLPPTWACLSYSLYLPPLYPLPTHPSNPNPPDTIQPGMHLLTHTLSFQSKQAPPCHRGDMGCSAAILHPPSVVQPNHLYSSHCSRVIFNQTAVPPVPPCRLRARQRVLFTLNGLCFLCF